MFVVGGGGQTNMLCVQLTHPRPPPPLKNTHERIGRTAGLEWLPRLLPGPLQDRVLSKALAMDAIAPTLRANAAALVAAQQEREREAGLVGVGGGGATSGSGGDGNTRKRR